MLRYVEQTLFNKTNAFIKLEPFSVLQKYEYSILLKLSLLHTQLKNQRTIPLSSHHPESHQIVLLSHYRLFCFFLHPCGIKTYPMTLNNDVL